MGLWCIVDEYTSIYAIHTHVHMFTQHSHILHTPVFHDSNVQHPPTMTLTWSPLHTCPPPVGIVYWTMCTHGYCILGNGHGCVLLALVITTLPFVCNNTIIIIITHTTQPIIAHTLHKLSSQTLYNIITHHYTTHLYSQRLL